MRGLRFSPASALLSPPLTLTPAAAAAAARTTLLSLPATSSTCPSSSPARPTPRTIPPAPLYLQLQQLRLRHVSLAPRPNQVPRPTPFVPDVPTFLKLIGRDLKKVADKFPSWEALFTLKSAELKELGVQPARTRKYLLRWLERFRNGEYGPGGDFAYVRDGVAALRVGRDIKRDTVWVVNIPLDKDTTVAKDGEGQEQQEQQGTTTKTTTVPGASATKLADFLERFPRERHAVPREYHAHGTGRISGPQARPNPREIGGATVYLVEGMWEERRGVKLDGGERRRDQKRFERRVQERRAAREARNAEELAKRGG